MGFWNASYWLPRGVEWEDIKGTSVEGSIFPTSFHLWYTLFFGLVLLAIRFAFENYVFCPLAYYLRKTSPVTRQDVLDLEKKYRRMAECSARSIYYTLSFIWGIVLLFSQPQYQDLTDCWRNWPFHPVPEIVAWYYMIQGGFYLSLIFGILFLDPPRSDFKEMLCHHIMTYLLIYISWTMNMVRVGHIILILHDSVDIFIDLAKVLRYDNRKMALNVCFVTILLIWTTTRVIYYPFWVLRSIWFDAPALIQSDYSWLDIFQKPFAPRFIMALLSLLQLLNFFWTYILYQILYESIFDGVLDDVREDFDEESKIRKTQQKKNE